MNKNLHYPTILVIDDHYAVDSSSLELSHYDKNCFLEDYSDDRFSFIFCSGFDAQKRVYDVKVVEKYLQSLKNLPDIILLDVMFGDDEYLGVDILKMLTLKYPDLAVVMMTSKQKNELFDITRDIGAIDYLVKPLNRQELHETLWRYTTVDKKHLLIGYENDFLTIVKKVALSKTTLMVQTEDEFRAKMLFSYRARIDDIKLNYIYIDNKDLVEDICLKIDEKSFNLFIGLENQTFSFQETLLTYLEYKKIDSNAGAIFSNDILQLVKQHTFNQSLYLYLSSTSVTLHKIHINSKDALMLFRYYFNMLKPKDIYFDVSSIDNQLLKKLFLKNELTLDEIVDFLEKMFLDICDTIEIKTILEFSRRYCQKDVENESFESIKTKLDSLKIKEFELLIQALKKTQKDGKKPNKSLAIMKLLNQNKASTNQFDRWTKKVWKELPKQKQQEYINNGVLDSLDIRV
jgi:CheY-like chemotaxis protein